VASQLIEEVTSHAQRDSLEDPRELFADGTYFPNNLRTLCGQNVELLNVKLSVHILTTGLKRLNLLPYSSLRVDRCVASHLLSRLLGLYHKVIYVGGL
jgi:hypothetical protein